MTINDMDIGTILISIKFACGRKGFKKLKN